MRRAAFTVDVDRDVNVPVPGRREAMSQPRNGDGSPRFSSSARGLTLLVELLNELSIRGTFFLEAETARHIAGTVDLRRLLREHEIASHGLSHEDLTGASTGLPFTGSEATDAVDLAADEIHRLTGRVPKGFRAPYQHVDDTIHRLLSDRGYLYDSSMTDDIRDRCIGPRPLPCGLTEFPLARGIDARGKHIHSYFWPMHEGKRRPADYIHLLDQFDDGLMVLATHSWHVVETYAGRLDDDQVAMKLGEIRAVLDGARDRGITFTTLEEDVRRGAEDGRGATGTV